MSLQISDKVKALAAQAQADLAEQFACIDAIAEENTQKVLAAFQKHRVAEAHFAGTTGYGYDDLGRDTLDLIFADLFHTEDALVRVQFVNGTHAISCALFGALKPGDILVSAVGAPYDTMLGVIGVVDKGPGSLKSYGIEYRQVDLVDNAPDPVGLAEAVRDPRVKAVIIQRSRGYATRASLSVAEIGALAKVVKDNNPGAAVLVDNCYGEFVETIEPTQVGADLVVGSLIKNPGGGLAPTGGYIAGRHDLIEGAAMRLTTPGIGKECGSTFGANRSLYQGLFLAPHTTAQAVKTAVFAARIMELRLCRPDHGAAGLPGGARLRRGAPRHHPDGPFRLSRAPEEVLQGHPVRRSRGLLRHPRALGYAGLRLPGHHGRRRLHPGRFH